MEAFGTDHKKKILDTLDKCWIQTKTDQCEAVLMGVCLLNLDFES